VVTQRRSRVFGPSRCCVSFRVEPPNNPIVRQYVLPDFSLNRPGKLLEPGQVVKDASWQILAMNNERFTVPEILFTPSDIGMFFASRQMNECDTDRPRAEQGWIRLVWLRPSHTPFLSFLKSCAECSGATSDSLVATQNFQVSYHACAFTPIPVNLCVSLYLISPLGHERCRIRMSELRSLASVEYEITIYQSPE